MRWKLFIVGVLLGSLVFQALVTNAEPRDAMPVAFLTQFDGSAFAGTDCGPTSVAMAINYATGAHLTPLEVRQSIARLPGGGYAANASSGTAILDLARIARANSVEVFAGDGAGSTGWGSERIRKHLGEGHPVIVLARLALLPGYSATSQFDHYVLLIGANASGFIYNDPGMSAGARRTISDKQLQAAQRASSVPGQGIALAGPAASKAPTANKPNGQSNQTVTVTKGDTLSQIAVRYGVALKEIAELNRAILPNIDRIQIGQVLVLPSPPHPTISGGAAAAEPEPEQPARPSRSSMRLRTE